MRLICRFAFALAPLGLFAGSSPVRAAPEYGRIPAYFEKNLGQSASNTLFTARGEGYSLALQQNGAALTLAGPYGKARVGLELVKANGGATVAAEDPLPGHSNYYIGNDPKRWITGVPQFGQVRYRSVYPGIDLMWHGNQQQLEYDLILGPGADPRKIRLRFDGADSTVIADNGDLLLKIGGSELRQLLPAVWQQRGSERVRIDAHYVLLAKNQVGVRVANYDCSLPLTIDPVLSYSTFLGGTGTTNPSAIAVDTNGDAYMTGTTTTNDFPGTSGAGGLFVAELNPAGTGVTYVTYFGGATNSYNDQASAIAVDSSGNVHVAGRTSSNTFPTTPGTLEPTRITFNSTGFVVEFGPNGQIAWGTYLGGSVVDAASAIATDDSGNSYVAGFSSSTDFPATSGACASNQDAFVATLNATASALLSAVCFGGNSTDAATAVALDSELNVYVAGTTLSTNLPTTQGAFQSSLQGSQDAFVAKLTSGSLDYLTYLGGSSNDSATSLAVDSGGNAYVAGYTESENFPTTAGAFDPSRPVNSYNILGFITKLNAAGTELVWSTYLGGSSTDQIYGVSVDTPGNTYVAGTTTSTDFPTTPGAFFSSQGAYYYNPDVFVSQLSADGSTLEYSGRIGSTDSDSATAVTRSALGALYVTGTTSSPNYPTTPGAYETVQPTPNNTSGFVTKVDMTSPTMCTVELSAAGTQVPGYGGSGSFNVTIPTGCPWEAISDYSNVTLGEVTHGTSSATVSFTVSVNNSTTSSQTMTITIGPATYTITQEAGSCSEPVFNPASLTFGNAGGLQNANVTLPSSCPRIATVSSGWIQITSGGNTTGSGNVGVYVPENSFAQRTGTVTIAGQTIPVTENAGSCTATVIGPAMSFPESGGTGSFEITTSAPSCEWGVYGVPSWMQINAVSPSGQGSANLGFIVAPNPTPVAQAATLTLAGQPVTVTQDAGPFDNTPDSYVATVFAGNGQCCGTPLGDGGPATSASLWNPRGLAWQNGNLYIADSANDRVRVVTPDGLINTFAGGGTSTTGGPATTVNFGGLYSLSFAPNGTMYVATDGYCCVWSVANGMASIFAGNGTNGPGDQLSYPDGVTADSGGNVYIADTGNERIREVSGGVVTTIAGNETCTFGGDNGPALAASFCGPQGLAWSSGNLLVADTQDHRVRTFPPGGTITTFAGGGSGSSPAAGSYVPATSVAITSPSQLATGANSDLYIADFSLPAIWRVIRWDMAILQAPLISNITTGIGVTLQAANGVAADDAGNVYVSDASYVWKLTPAYSTSFCQVNRFTGGAPLVLDPTNGATGLVTDPILTWTTVTGATSYNVYFGTSNSPPLAASATCTSYSAEGLAPGTTYYWQVVPQGSSGLTPSAVQSFTTQGGPAISSLSPASAVPGGETFTLTVNGTNFVSGDTTVQWNGSTLSTTFVSATEVTASVTPDLIATAGIAAVTVMNTGGAPSNGVGFPIRSGPAAASVSPGGGYGSSQSFTFTFSDPSGWQNLGVVDVVINRFLNGSHACYIAYSVTYSALYLVDDAGDAGGPFAGSMVLPGTGSVSNSQCTVNGTGSSAVGSGTTLTLTLNIAFSSSFDGNKVIYTAARDTGTGNSGWQALGTWGAPGAVATVTEALGVTPGSGSGESQTYTFTFSDSNGWQDLSIADVLMNNFLNGHHACYIAYSVTYSTLYLVDDAGDAGGPFAGTMVLPGSGTISNSQCTVNGTGSSAVGSGNTLTLTLNMSFTGTFMGNRVFYTAARNAGTANSGWQALGAWAVP
jgi:hypothetical protein